MSKFSIQEFILVFKVIKYFLGVIGAIIIIYFGVVAFIYRTDRKRNEKHHEKLFSKTDDLNSRLSKIEGKLKL